jgi:hypothetical protein
LTLASYNAGPENEAIKEGRIPQNNETPGYVAVIMQNWRSENHGSSQELANTINASINAYQNGLLYNNRVAMVTYMDKHSIVEK